MDNEPFDKIYAGTFGINANDFNAIRDYTADWRNGEPSWADFWAGHFWFFADSGIFDSCKKAVMNFIQSNTGDIPSEDFIQSLKKWFVQNGKWIAIVGTIIGGLGITSYIYKK